MLNKDNLTPIFSQISLVSFQYSRLFEPRMPFHNVGRPFPRGNFKYFAVLTRFLTTWHCLNNAFFRKRSFLGLLFLPATRCQSLEGKSMVLMHFFLVNYLIQCSSIELTRSRSRASTGARSQRPPQLLSRAAVNATVINEWGFFFSQNH